MTTGQEDSALDIFRHSESMMSMDDETWARHANPWSVWTRFSCLPLLILAIWSRVWLGWWCLIPVALAIAWTWYNPRAFSPPATLDHWPGKATRGERIFLARKETPIPKHHERAAYILTLGSALGAIPLIYGLIMLDVWATVVGLIATVLPKVWFCDRMVWLFEDVTNPAIPTDEQTTRAAP